MILRQPEPPTDQCGEIFGLGLFLIQELFAARLFSDDDVRTDMRLSAPRFTALRHRLLNVRWEASWLASL